MRILEIVPSLSSGGGERLVTDLSNELAKTNEVYLLTLWDDTIDNNGFYKPELSDDVHYINANVVERNKMAVMWSIVKHIKGIKPGIVHLHMSHMFSLLALLLLGHKYKFFLTIHSDVRTIYASPKIKLIFNFFGKKKWLRFVTISRKNFNDFNEVYPKLENHLIYNGRAPMVPTEKFDAVKQEIASYKKDDNTRVILHVARFSPQKNQKLLIDSFNEILESGRNLVLLVIGAHFDTEEGERLKATTGKGIYFLGTRTNISDYMLQSDVFVLSSRWEGMPITLIEAILSGTPMVSTPVTGAVDVINGKNGVLSKDFTKESFIVAVDKVLDNYDAYKAEAMKEKDNSPYTIKRCAESYLRLFEKTSQNRM